MSGGVLRVRRDGVEDFMSLRKDTFGFEMAPLPQSFQLSAADSRLNSVTKTRVRANMPLTADQPSAVQFQTPISALSEGWREGETAFGNGLLFPVRQSLTSVTGRSSHNGDTRYR